MKSLKLFLEILFIGGMICSAPFAMAIASGAVSHEDCNTQSDEYDYDYDEGFEEPDKPKYNLESHTKNLHTAALALFNYLEKNVKKVAFVGRVGGDLSQYIFKNPSQPKYTHVGIVWKKPKNGKWYFTHVLNTCSGPTSDIYEQNLAEFFNDDPFMYDVWVGVPSIHLQNKIARILEDGFFHVVHISDYSNIANPYATEYQNSNGWVLNIIAMAQSSKIIGANKASASRQKKPSTTFSSNKEYIKQLQQFYENRFVPTQAFVEGAMQFFGSAFRANVAVSDHSTEEANSNWFNIVSVASVFNYLKQTDTHFKDTEICHLGVCNRLVSELNKN